MPPLPIFQDANGVPLKFFMQKDLPQPIQTEVCETIVALGGRVETKVPRVGYVLVQPDTAEEDRLRVCWASPDRPERYFVPYTFVDACKIQGTLLKQIFIHEGQPMRIHIHPSIANVNVRAALSQRIMHSGGDPTASAQSARVILADPNTEVFETLVKTYQNQPGKYIESFLWVKKCVEKGEVTYTPVVYKNPGGRRAGEERTHFTEEDETNLCNWIATKIPFKETGGRTGNRLYQQLVDMAHDPEYNWVTRHTWQSWRERYKKNAARLDIKIAEIVERNKPNKGEKGQYGYVRQPEEKAKRTKRKTADVEGEPVAGPSTAEMDFMADSVLLPLPMTMSVPPLGPIQPTFPLSAAFASSTTPLPGPGPGPGPSSSTFPPMSVPPEVLAARRDASEEEDDEGEWQIREGQEPTPAWAKRKAAVEAEEDVQGSRKRLRSDMTTTAGADPVVAAPASTETLFDKAVSTLHVIDQAIMDIARQFRFTTEEVKEYYDKCGDINRTTRRFSKMRDVLTNLPDDDEVPVSDPPPVIMGVASSSKVDA